VSWTEISPDVFVRGYPQDDITITVVRGAFGLLLVDTGGSPAVAARILSDMRELGNLRCVVNTHAHYDHTFGNQQFGPTSHVDVPIYGHQLLSAHLDEYERPRLAAWRSGNSTEPPRDWSEVVITPPTQLVRERSWVDIGDSAVELIPLDPGHTDGDLVIRVPSRGDGHGDTWIVGDVLEEPGPPMYGSGCYPMRWPMTLATLLDEIGEHDVIVAGHGQPISRAFAVAQLSILQATAERIRQHHRAGDDIPDALSAASEWAYPPAALQLAIQRGYAELDEKGTAAD
jgi:glyoxylase-like metal-dependent hydrolase (beta-lactamase superfamily II)